MTSKEERAEEARIIGDFELRKRIENCPQGAEYVVALEQLASRANTAEHRLALFEGKIEAELARGYPVRLSSTAVITLMGEVDQDIRFGRENRPHWTSRTMCMALMRIYDLEKELKAFHAASRANPTPSMEMTAEKERAETAIKALSDLASYAMTVRLDMKEEREGVLFASQTMEWAEGLQEEALKAESTIKLLAT